MIKEEEPPKPSTRLSTTEELPSIAANRGLDPKKLSGLMRGELDWIVMKSLEKDRNRRYETASAFAADILRYLNDETVEACPPSTAYRFRKFVRRNNAALTTATLIATALLIGTAVSTWQAVRATEAEGQANSLRELAEGSAKEAQRQTTEAVKAQGAALLAQEDALRAEREAERQRNEVSQNLYFADMRLGLVDWRSGNTARLSEKLLNHLPQTGGDDLRGWEWYYLLSLCHQDQRTLMYHAQQVTSVAWSPDGRYFASTADREPVRVYDAASQRLLHTWATWTGGACWSPDSRWLSWGSSFGPISLANVESGELKFLLGHTSWASKTAWSSDGKHLASISGDRTIRIWNPVTGSCVRVIEGIVGRLTGVAWHPHGKVLASITPENGLSFWETENGELLPAVFPNHFPCCIAWTPDGKQLALGTRSGNCLLYDTTKWSLLSQWKCHAGFVNAMAWQPDGSRLASAGADGLIHIWNPADQKCVYTLRGHQNQVLSLAWEPMAERLVSGSMDTTVKVWSLPPASQPLRLAGHPGGVRAIIWCAEAQYLRSLGADGSIAQWNVVKGECERTGAVPNGRSASFNSDGMLLANLVRSTEEPAIFIHDGRSGERTRMLKRGPNRTQLCLVSPDGSKLACVARGALEILDLRKEDVQFRWEAGPYHSLSWSPNGQRLAAAGWGDPVDGDPWYAWVHVVDVEQRQRILKLKHGASQVHATAVAWSPNGDRLVSGDYNGLVEVWQIPAGRKVTSVQLHIAEVRSLDWSPDGRRIASAGADHTVRLLEPASGEELLRLDVPDVDTRQLEWSRDGRRLAAATAEGPILIWDASPGYELVESETFVFERARHRFNQAARLWGAGDKMEAVRILKQTLDQEGAQGTSLTACVATSIWPLWRSAMESGQYDDGIALGKLLFPLNRDDVGLPRWLNNFAWSLATRPAAEVRDFAAALSSAQKATELEPKQASYWNTLGVVLYRQGDCTGAVSALERSMQCDKGDHGWNYFFLAMAHWQLGHKEEAEKWFRQAVEWMDKNAAKDEELLRFRAEAEELMGLNEEQE